MGCVQSKETLWPHNVPDRQAGNRPDEFERQELPSNIVDYFSNFVEVDRLEDTTSKAVVYKLKTRNSTHRAVITGIGRVVPVSTVYQSVGIVINKLLHCFYGVFH